MAQISPESQKIQLIMCSIQWKPYNNVQVIVMMLLCCSGFRKSKTQNEANGISLETSASTVFVKVASRVVL